MDKKTTIYKFAIQALCIWVAVMRQILCFINHEVEYKGHIENVPM